MNKDERLVGAIEPLKETSRQIGEINRQQTDMLAEKRKNQPQDCNDFRNAVTRLSAIADRSHKRLGGRTP